MEIEKKRKEHYTGCSCFDECKHIAFFLSLALSLASLLCAVNIYRFEYSFRFPLLRLMRVSSFASLHCTHHLLTIAYHVTQYKNEQSTQAANNNFYWKTQKEHTHTLPKKVTSTKNRSARTKKNKKKYEKKNCIKS